MPNSKELTLLSREEFKEALKLPLGKYAAKGHENLIEKINTDDYHGSDDLYEIHAESADDYVIAFIRIKLSLYLYAAKCIEDTKDPLYYEDYCFPPSVEMKCITVTIYVIENFKLYDKIREIALEPAKSNKPLEFPFIKTIPHGE